MENLLLPFILTFVAGLSTGLGGMIVFLMKEFDKRLFSIMLGFSAGVMLYLSFVEILQESLQILNKQIGEKVGTSLAIIAFFGGIFLIAIIDKLVPEYENPHEMYCDASEKNRKNCLYKIGMFSAVVIFIHNFPEGLATFMSGTIDLKLGVFMTIAILIHNIPEGMAIAVPVYYATGDKKKAIKLSFLSGLSEPIAAIVGYAILGPFINQTVLAIVFAVIAGIMVYIALDELLPSAEKYGEHHIAMYGVIVGMSVMAASLILM